MAGFFFCYTIQLITSKLCTKFQNPKPLSSCWEIFDGKKKFTDRQTNKQTNIITEKAKTIYPLYTSYRGYNLLRTGGIMVCNNHNLHLVNMNAYIKFGENLSIYSQDIG